MSDIKFDIEKEKDLLTSLLVTKNNKRQQNKHVKKCTNKSNA